MKNNIEDLRNILCATLVALTDEAAPMELDRARTIAEVAQALINTLEVEVDFLRLSGEIRGIGFMVQPGSE